MRAGLDGYGESFIEHHVLRLLYPGSLTREIQLGLAAGVVIVNLLLYAWAFLRPALRARRGS